MSSAEREARVYALLPLVRHLARRVHRMVPSRELDDLIGDGCVALIRAVDAYDAARGVPLAHFARRLILGAMLNGVRRNDPVAERMRRTIRLADQARYALAQEQGALPTPCEMEACSPMLARARTEAHRRNALSLDSSLPRGERLAPDWSGDPQAILVERLDREQIYRAIAQLPPRERSIVLAHYFGGRKLRDLVEPMRISPQRVSQLHLRAMRAMRATLTASA